jgi:SAM-dependent methyltransferase
MTHIGNSPQIVSYERSILWCKKHIQPVHPKFQFLHTDVWSERYNPKGAKPGATFRLPFDDQSLDIIYLYSVFSHMLTDDVRIYAGEFKRVLASGGSVFLTAFVEDNVPDVVENPVGYKMAWDSVLHCVRYNAAFLKQVFADAGFQISNFVYGQETDGQSAIYLVPSEANPQGSVVSDL